MLPVNFPQDWDRVDDVPSELGWLPYGKPVENGGSLEHNLALLHRRLKEEQGRNDLLLRENRRLEAEVDAWRADEKVRRLEDRIRSLEDTIAKVREVAEYGYWD